jgi:hypothetical protein
MLNFKKNKVLLLRVLRDLVTEHMDNASINSYLEQEVAEFLIEIKDKRRIRKLKQIRKELDKFIEETKNNEELCIKNI